MNEERAIETDGLGNILYSIRDQDGTLTPMKCKDTQSNRMFVQWLRVHDGYSGSGPINATISAL